MTWEGSLGEEQFRLGWSLGRFVGLPRGGKNHHWGQQHSLCGSRTIEQGEDAHTHVHCTRDRGCSSSFRSCCPDFSSETDCDLDGTVKPQISLESFLHTENDKTERDEQVP